MRCLCLRMLCVPFLMLALVACKQENPNPELLDPIYKDLKARADSYSKNYEETKAQIATLRESEQKAEPHTIELKDIRRDLAKALKQQVGNEQLARYYKIRAERRRVLGRRAYREAFAKGEEWPKPEEYTDYLVNIRLHEINLNWNARVPKLQGRAPDKEKPKKQ